MRKQNLFLVEKDYGLEGRDSSHTMGIATNLDGVMQIINETMNSSDCVSIRYKADEWFLERFKNSFKDKRRKNFHLPLSYASDNELSGVRYYVHRVKANGYIYA